MTDAMFRPDRPRRRSRARFFFVPGEGDVAIWREILTEEASGFLRSPSKTSRDEDDLRMESILPLEGVAPIEAIN
jgi:hypothetical protein